MSLLILVDSFVVYNTYTKNIDERYTLTGIYIVLVTAGGVKTIPVEKGKLHEENLELIRNPPAGSKILLDLLKASGIKALTIIICIRWYIILNSQTGFHAHCYKQRIFGSVILFPIFTP